MHAMIHSFSTSGTLLDDDGDPMIGSYYQLINADDIPVTELIGPYRDHVAAAKAAQRAFASRDF